MSDTQTPRHRDAAGRYDAPQADTTAVRAAPAEPLSMEQYARFNELMTQSEGDPGLSEDEYAELQALHDQATAYAAAWVSAPDVALASTMQGTQLLSNAVRYLSNMVPTGHGLSMLLDQFDAALSTAGHAMIAPLPVPPMPSPPAAQAAAAA